MKILILSDSHGSLETMRRAAEKETPQAIIHLGDYWKDGCTLKEQFPQIPFYQVAGNCDRYQCGPDAPEVLVRKFEDVQVYMTHGHLQRVKGSLLSLTYAAREAGAQVALFGHTHCALCHKLDDMLLMNPGTCSMKNGTYGILEIDGSEVKWGIHSLLELNWEEI